MTLKDSGFWRVHGASRYFQPATRESRVFFLRESLFNITRARRDGGKFKTRTYSRPPERSLWLHRVAIQRRRRKFFPAESVDLCAAAQQQ